MIMLTPKVKMIDRGDAIPGRNASQATINGLALYS